MSEASLARASERNSEERNGAPRFEGKRVASLASPPLLAEGGCSLATQNKPRKKYLDYAAPFIDAPPARAKRKSMNPLRNRVIHDDLGPS